MPPSHAKHQADEAVVATNDALHYMALKLKNAHNTTRPMIGLVLTAVANNQALRQLTQYDPLHKP